MNLRSCFCFYCPAEGIHLVYLCTLVISSSSSCMFSFSLYGFIGRMENNLYFLFVLILYDLVNNFSVV